MNFEKTLQVDQNAVFAAMGFSKATASAALAIEKTATPRWIYTSIENLADLPGQSIQAHLAGCASGILIAVTLGLSVDSIIRSTEALNMEQAVLLDACASTLVEQYADQAEELLHRQFKDTYLTSRFSPGYGDFPIRLQKEWVSLLDAERKIGLTANTNAILLPRKSITAILGLSDHPVPGQLAGCEFCALYENCTTRKKGDRCGKRDFKKRPLHYSGRRHGYHAAKSRSRRGGKAGGPVVLRPADPDGDPPRLY